jgi:hypothetical protein
MNETCVYTVWKIMGPFNNAASGPLQRVARRRLPVNYESMATYLLVAYSETYIICIHMCAHAPKEYIHVATVRTNSGVVTE